MMNLYEVSEFKKYLMETHETVLHFHDTCGGQSFSLSKTSPEILSSIKDYLLPLGYTAIFASDHMGFRLRKD